MASIKAKESSVKLFYEQCSDNYSAILNIANDLLSRSEKYRITIQEELERISEQLIRVQRLRDEIDRIVNSYMRMKEEAADEINSCRERIDYIYNHPSRVTTTDYEGNETTEEVVDYDAIHAAEREQDTARYTYGLYGEKCNDAKAVLREAEYMVSRFQNIKYGIEAVLHTIQNDIYEIKKYIKAIEEETEFNIHSLKEVVESLQAYLSSKAIFMPNSTRYDEFATAGFGGVTGGNNAGGNAPVERPKVRKFKPKKISMLRVLFAIARAKIAFRAHDKGYKTVRGYLMEVGGRLVIKILEKLTDTPPGVLNEQEEALSAASHSYDEVYAARCPEETLSFRPSPISQELIDRNTRVVDTEALKLHEIHNAPYSKYNERIKQTPKASNGSHWSGQRGESRFVLDKPLSCKNGAIVSEIFYKNGVPDFSNYALSQIKISNMTNNRSSNFKQADEVLAERWTKIKHDGKPWTARDISNFRTNNGLTWHETNNMETMQLVPTEINATFGHLGGVGEYNAMIGQGGSFFD